MLNSTSLKVGSNSQTVNFNTPSTGILQKSHPKSRFIRFQINSEMEDWIFPSDKDSKPVIKSKDKWNTYKKHPITVLQVMVFRKNYYLCEIVENQFLTEEK